MGARKLVKPSPLVDELAQVIGEPAVMRLCEALGGTRVYIPRVIGPNNPIAAAIGAKPAAALAEHYYGTVLILPKAHVRRERAIELAKSGEMTVAQAALQCDYSERHLYRLLAAEDDGQLSLLDLL